MSIRDTDYKPQKAIPLKSPLAIGGFMIHFLRQRFLPKKGTEPWTWSPDPTQTAIVIESGQTTENEVRNKKPGIYVNLSTLTAMDLVIGDKAFEPLNIRTESSIARLNLGVGISIESPKRGECFSIGWIVHSSFLAAHDLLRQKYEFIDMGPFTLNPPVPSKKDQEIFISAVTFNISYDVTWKETAVQTFVNDIELTIDLQGKTSPTEFFTDIYRKDITNKFVG